MTTREPGRILIVDHSRGGLMFQGTLLRRRQSQILTSMAGSQALVKARDIRPHLIMFVYDLFDMSAPEFCREIRADDATKDTSLLLVAEREHQEHVDLTMAAGCNDVIYRPLERRELDLKIEKLTSIPARRQLRTITKIDLSVERNGRFILGRSVNVSANGMLVELDRVIAGDSGHVRLNFYLPGDPVPLQLEAEILRAEFAGSSPKYGLKFLNVEQKERDRIEFFVHRLRSRELI
jgi:response regulator RpfG family c-di-GMP phosphodiesterase